MIGICLQGCPMRISRPWKENLSFDGEIARHGKSNDINTEAVEIKF